MFKDLEYIYIYIQLAYSKRLFFFRKRRLIADQRFVVLREREMGINTKNMELIAKSFRRHIITMTTAEVHGSIHGRLYNSIYYTDVHVCLYIAIACA